MNEKVSPLVEKIRSFGQKQHNSDEIIMRDERKCDRETDRKNEIEKKYPSQCLPPVVHSHVKVFTRVVPMFSIVMRREFSLRSVKRTGAEVFSDA